MVWRSGRLQQHSEGMILAVKSCWQRMTEQSCMVLSPSFPLSYCCSCSVLPHPFYSIQLLHNSPRSRLCTGGKTVALYFSLTLMHTKGQPALHASFPPCQAFFPCMYVWHVYGCSFVLVCANLCPLKVVTPKYLHSISYRKSEGDVPLSTGRRA